MKKVAQENMIGEGGFSRKCISMGKRRNGIAMEYFDSGTNEVWQFQQVNSCLKMNKDGVKM
jgi:hypothetical protein